MAKESLYVPASMRPIVIKTVNRLQNDPQSVLSDVVTPDNYIYTTHTDGASGLSYGTWINPRTGSVATFHVIGPLGYSMSNYMDINARPGLSVSLSSQCHNEC